MEVAVDERCAPFRQQNRAAWPPANALASRTRSETTTFRSYDPVMIPVPSQGPNKLIQGALAGNGVGSRCEHIRHVVLPQDCDAATGGYAAKPQLATRRLGEHQVHGVPGESDGRGL